MIPLFKPSYTEKEEQAVLDTMRSGWVGLGPKTEEFEKKFAKYVGAKYAVGVNSATSALDLAVKAYGIHDGEIIVPALTFVSTALVALYNKCDVVFADVNENDLCMDWGDMLNKMTSKTKAIIPVWYGGRNPNLFGYPKGVVRIDDCSHAAGNKQTQKLTTACWSFHAVKNLATGDGGMVTTDDEIIYQKLLALRWCGINRSTWERSQKKYGWDYDINEIGYKYHMNDLTASLGLVQLERLDENNLKRRYRVLQYLRELQHLSWLRLPDWDDQSSWHLFVVRVGGRNKFIDYMLAHGVSAGVHYKPLNYYSIFPKTKLKVTDSVWRELVTLPLFPDMTDEEFAIIVDSVKAYKP